MSGDYWLGLGAAERFGVRFSEQLGEYVEVGYDVLYEAFYIDRGNFVSMPVLSEAFKNILLQHFPIKDAESICMQIILHEDTVELFSSDGIFQLADAFYPSLNFEKIELFAENGKIKVKYISLSSL